MASSAFMPATRLSAARISKDMEWAKYSARLTNPNAIQITRINTEPRSPRDRRGPFPLPMNRFSVAQVANLPYRRLLIGEALGRRTASGLATRDTADTAVCATAEAQHDAVPEAGAPLRRGSWSQCAVARTW